MQSCSGAVSADMPKGHFPLTLFPLLSAENAMAEKEEPPRKLSFGSVWRNSHPIWSRRFFSRDLCRPNCYFFTQHKTRRRPVKRAKVNPICGGAAGARAIEVLIKSTFRASERASLWLSGCLDWPLSLLPLLPSSPVLLKERASEREAILNKNKSDELVSPLRPFIDPPPPPPAYLRVFFLLVIPINAAAIVLLRLSMACKI